MATRSYIGVSTSKGINVMYCHFDGYPSYNGVILRDNYKDIDKVNDLINLGSISQLKTDVANCVKHPNIKPVLYKSKDTLLKEVQDGYIEYIYIFNNGYWTCFDSLGNTILINEK